MSDALREQRDMAVFREQECRAQNAKSSDGEGLWPEKDIAAELDDLRAIVELLEAEGLGLASDPARIAAKKAKLAKMKAYADSKRQEAQNNQIIARCDGLEKRLFQSDQQNAELAMKVELDRQSSVVAAVAEKLGL